MAALTVADWVTAPAFGNEVGITRRAAVKALRRAFEGYHWRGVLLKVRAVHGRGGRSGLCYEVSLRSLSEALESPLNDAVPYLPTPSPERRFSARSDQDVVIGGRLAAVQAAVAHPPRSPERIAAIKAAVAAGTPERTVRRWIANYEAHGIDGLANERPKNAGAPRVAVSREFDRAFLSAGYEAELLAEIGAAVGPQIAGLWASRAERSGWREIGRMAEFLLLETCEAHSVELAPAAFRISRRAIESFGHFRVVNQRRNDRKAYDDAKPRVRRSWQHLAPMDVIVADVKPLDILFHRPDGSEVYPRVIGFFDPPTGRLFVDLVLCEKGEGVRQEHINEAFLAMVSHPEWGFPRSIYTDNGSELKGLEKLRPALALVNEPGARSIIYAKPYNASAKPVESAFARLDRYVTPHFDGYAGKDRMTKKTQTVGRPPQPYPHDFERFQAEFYALVQEMDHTAYVGGERRGRSAMQILEERISRGWRPTIASPQAVDAAFCNIEERKVGKHGVSIGAIQYTHTELHGFIGRKVRVALPWRRGGAPLFETGNGWAYLTPDQALPADWIEGARETVRRQRSQDRSVAALAKVATEVDPVALKLRMAARRKTVALPPPAIPLDMGGQLARLADSQSTGEALRDIELTDAQRRKVARDRETASLLRLEKANAA